MLTSCASAASTKTPNESYNDLKQGKEFFEKGNYVEALGAFKIAYAKLPVIRDYILFFMARALNRTDHFEDSTGCINELLSSYPDSPLMKKARQLQIMNLLLSRETVSLSQILSGGKDYGRGVDTILIAMEAYVADYPEDAQITFLTARLLKRCGKVEGAKKLFLAVYMGNSVFSEQAYQELQPQDVTAEHSFTKASNLMKMMEYKKAEALIRKILPVAKGPLKTDSQKTLGVSLFRQKRYREASDAFISAGDPYNSARSLYRAGELAAFMGTISRLVSMEDKRAGSLLIAYAAKKRRDGKPEESLAIYARVRKDYPFLNEEALWGIAWTYYRKGDYRSASELFSELNGKYPESRYLYWGRRSAELEGRDNSSPDKNDEVPQGKSVGKDFYKLLSYAHYTNSLSGRSVSTVQWTPSHRSSSGERPIFFAGTQKLPASVTQIFERVAILAGIGMKEEAISELVRTSDRNSSREALLEVCRTLQDMGAYKKSISLISRLSDAKGVEADERADIQDILYPMAYWPTVSAIARLYNLDPLVLLAVMREESRFDPDARSVAGALGLMQIMPQTAYSIDKYLGMDISDNSEIYDVRVNITIGAYHLNSLLRDLGSLPLALAAYNAGQDNVKEWIKEGNYKSLDEFIEDIPYDETRNYVKRVLLTYFTYLDLGNRL
ncbi:MAG TPA: lytic transglycosylase domain-containing protein [Thermodesulfovibrionales bacterium]|nr:lytic transglycosylase domain-containing protein [Thermodesulfovibrionales bacterium]